MSIGDVSSDARGSGARYNDGKLRLDYIPARILFFVHGEGRDAVEAEILWLLGQFETHRDTQYLVDALALVPWEATCAVFDYGARKYAAWNWAKGMPWTVPLACAKRHLLAILRDDELDDPESGLLHLGHVGCNLVMLLHYWEFFPEGDDLPPRALFDTTAKPADCGECRKLVYYPDGLVDKSAPAPAITEGKPEQWLAAGDYKPLTDEDYKRMRESTCKS